MVRNWGLLNLQASDALLDSSEEARCVAVRLVWAIAFHYAEKYVTTMVRKLGSFYLKIA